MALITHTNIIVDDFNNGARNLFQNYVYFLTHFHQDHWSGLNSSWNYGKIYCSDITKKLVLNQFPNIKDIESLDLNVPHIIFLNESKSLFVEVHLFDANHCPGSVMILFRGYMGTILHTGDFRFHPGMIENNLVLFPETLNDRDSIRYPIHIDELIFDDTFCDPIFKFPTKEHSIKIIIDIIEMHKGKRVYLCIDSIGKEDLMIELANHFQTQVVVAEERYRNILLMNYQNDPFTTNSQDGFIEVISKLERKEKAKTSNSISITPTAWASIKDYATSDEKHYVVLYSLHSDYKELETFIKNIQPGVLKKINKDKGVAEKEKKHMEFSDHLLSLKKLKQRGYEGLVNKYAYPEKVSAEYKGLRSREAQDKLLVQLGLKFSPEKKAEESSNYFNNEKMSIFKQRNKPAFSGKIPGLTDDRTPIEDQIKLLRKRNNLFSNGRASYSQLIQNTFSLREKSEKNKPSPIRLSPIPVKDHSSNPIREHSRILSMEHSPKLTNENSPNPVGERSTIPAKEDSPISNKERFPIPQQELYSTINHPNSATPVKQIAHEKENPEVIVVADKDIWDSCVFSLIRVKQEEFEEGRLIAVGDLIDEHRENNTMAIETCVSKENKDEAMISEETRENYILDKDQNLQSPENNDSNNIHIANIEHSKTEYEKKFVHSKVLLTRRSTSFYENDTLKDEDCDIEESKQESIKDSPPKPKLIRRPILKKSWNDNCDPGNNSSVCRSDSGSKKKVKFQGLIEDIDEEIKPKEIEKFPKQDASKIQQKTQIGLISKMLQHKLKDEEEKRGIINQPASKDHSEMAVKVFKKAYSQAQEKGMLRNSNSASSYNLKGNDPNSTGSKSKTYQLNSRLKMPVQTESEYSTYIDKDVVEESRIKENNKALSEDTELKKNQTEEVSMAELWKSLNNGSKKKLGSAQYQKTSRLDFFAKTNPKELNSNENDSFSKISQKESSHSKNEQKFVDESSQSSSQKSFETQQKELKDNNHFRIDDGVNGGSIGQKNCLTGHFNSHNQDNPNKKKVLINKLLRKKETPPQPDLKSPKEDKTCNSQKSSLSSGLNEEAPKNLSQEIEEFLRKIRLKRQQEKLLKAENAKPSESENHVNEDLVQPDVTPRDTKQVTQAKLSLNHIKNNQNYDDDEDFESRRSKLRIRNTANAYVTPNHDKDQIDRDLVETKTSKPIKRVAYEPTPDDDNGDVEYEEIIVVRRKIRSKTKKNSSISQNILQNQNISVEEILAQVSGRTTSKKLQSNHTSDFEDSPPLKNQQQQKQLQSRFHRSNSLAAQTSMQNNAIQKNKSNLQETDTDYEQPDDFIKERNLNVARTNLNTASDDSLLKNQKSADVIRKLLDGKSKGSMQSNTNTEIQSNLSRNEKGGDLQTLPQKINRKKNLIEEDDPDDFENLDDSDFQNSFYDENGRNKLSQRQSKMTTNQRKLEKYPPSHQLSSEIQLLSGFWKQHSKPLKSFPTGMVLTQSQHLKRVKKNNLVNHSTGETEYEAQEAFGQIFGAFIDKKVLK